MPKVKFVEPDGQEHVVHAESGESLMQAAVDNMVQGVLAECGGSGICATCHVIVDPQWFDRLPAIEDAEKAILEGALEVTDRSRLSCQIEVDDTLDGLTVRIPDHQL